MAEPKEDKREKKSERERERISYLVNWYIDRITLYQYWVDVIEMIWFNIFISNIISVDIKIS